MRVAVHILLFVLFFVTPFVLGLAMMDPPPEWYARITGAAAATTPAAEEPPREAAGNGDVPEVSPRVAPPGDESTGGAPNPDTDTAPNPDTDPAQDPDTDAAGEENDAPAGGKPVAEGVRPVRLRQPTVAAEAGNAPTDGDGDGDGDTSTPAGNTATSAAAGDASEETGLEESVSGQPLDTTAQAAAEAAPPLPGTIPERKPRRPIAVKVRPLNENPRYFQYSLEARADFDALARRDNVPGALGVRELKVLIAGVDTPSPMTFFLNTGRFPYHYCFVRDLLYEGLSHEVYKNATYYKSTGRKFLAASLVAHDNYRNPDGTTGAYIISFWPTDPVNFDYVSLTYDLIVDNMHFEHAPVYYQPSGMMQEELYLDEKEKFVAAGLPVMLATDFYSNFAFSPLNTGTSYGRLLLADPTSTYSARDIVVFKTLPNDLSVAAGILTEAPQTPLSHVNLKAQQNGIPNAYVRNATSNETLQALAGEYVRYEVTADDWRVTKATTEEVEAFLEASRPPAAPTPTANLQVTSILPLTAIAFDDSSAFGAKAANVAELGRILADGIAPRGFAVPFFLYDEFMRHNGLYAEAAEMIADQAFRSDAAFRRERLKAFREKIEDAEAPEWMLLKLAAMQDAFPEGTPLRCRSSTNNEDMEGFNGAGLYNSCTHREDEGHIIKSMKQVWASLWTYRAFEEREFYRVDHMKVYMGVLVHPNYDGEQANGVGITRNIFDPRWLGFYVNVQVGENLITNPDEESIPEEFLVSVMTGGPQDQAYSLEIQYARRSNKVPKGETVLNREQAVDLARNMRVIHRHFRDLYGRQYDDAFAMDIEFKIDAEGKLIIKQARPWVWPNLPPAEDTDC